MNNLTALVALFLVPATVGFPTNAAAQHRGRSRPARVVVSRPVLYSYNPFLYNPFFFDPFYSPWYGPWGGYAAPYRFRAAEASVRVAVEPRNANVYVDGFFAGTVDDFDGAFQRLHVTPGQHEIVVQLDGYRSHKERLYLGPSASRKISHQLERLAPGEPNEPPPAPPAAESRQGVDGGRDPRAGRGARPRRAPTMATSSRTSTTGTLSVRVVPADADIFIDGERWDGSADDVQLIVQLSEGPHRVDVRRDGYRPATLDVDVRRNETTPVNVSLSKE